MKKIEMPRIIEKDTYNTSSRNPSPNPGDKDCKKH